MDAGKSIRELRKEKGLTQAQLAKELNVSMMTIRRYESGKTKPTFEVLNKLCFLFGKSFFNLLYPDEVIVNDSEGYPVLREEQIDEFVDIVEKSEKKENNKLHRYLEKLFDSLNSEGQLKVFSYIIELIDDTKYKREVTEDDEA